LTLEYVLTKEGSEIIQHDLIKRLLEGQVGVLPTDTVYGLVCIAGHEEARNRIYDMKKREHGKPMQFLLGELRQVKWLNIRITKNLRLLAEAFWPGPMTLVLRGIDGHVHGVRIPDHPFVRELIEAIGRPLVASSANLAGNDPHESAANDFADLNGEPDFVVLHEREKTPSSTVVQLHDDGTVEIIREGVISKEKIQEALAAD
jgi:L-threonylcarbamoyladenylate synthase